MAITQNVQALSFFLKVADGVNQKGDMIYKRKTFSNLRKDADIEKIYNVADAISNLLSKDVADINLVKSSIVSAE